MPVIDGVYYSDHEIKWKHEFTYSTWADEVEDGEKVRQGSQIEAHKGHDWEPTETLMDNAVEGCRWAYCNTCERAIMEWVITMIWED